MAPAQQFRFNARSVFLTYPQCPEEKADLLLHFQTQYPVQYFCISTENHKDGNQHLHAWFKFDRKLNLKTATCFDYKGHHPNIIKPRSENGTLDYIRKDGDFIQLVPQKKDWAATLEATTKQEFLNVVCQYHPKEFINNYERIEFFANKRYASPPPEYTSKFTNFNIPDNLHQWVTSELHGQQDRPKSLILCSPTRFGKTEWARTLGPHMYFNNLFNLSDWKEDAHYIILDDLEWQHVHAKKAFFGAQKEFVLTDKYKRKLKVKWGKPLIYLCNDDTNPFKHMKIDEVQWYQENTYFIELYRPLF